MNVSRTFPIIATALTVLAASSLAEKPDLSKLPPAAKVSGVTYAKDIKPLFDASCIRCHGEQRPKAGLKLTTLESILKGSKDEKVVIPGKSEESPLVIAVARIDDDTAMPPKRGGGGGGPRRGPGNDSGPGGGPDRKGPPPDGGKKGEGQPGGQKGGPGNAPKPLTPDQVSLVRAWVDQGAK